MSPNYQPQTASAWFWFVVTSLFIVVAISGISIWRWGHSRSSQPSVLGQDVQPGALIVEGPTEVEVHRRFTLNLIADTANQPVNAVGIYADYDPLFLYIEDVDTSQSFCQFYPENKVNNAVGKLMLACGAPNPGYTGRDTIAKVTFVAKNSGKTSLRFDPEKTMILLNNGTGTNIFQDSLEYSINILNKI